VKPQRVDLDGVGDPAELVERVLRTRAGELRALTRGLDERDNKGLHDFRIACKRLRYAVERFQTLDSALGPIAERLAALQDALGEVHDRDVLLAILPPVLVMTERRLKSERAEYAEHATALWRELEQLMQALDSHRI
jgi:CHAD domain-containing protein